jgi:hypothetical protein
MSEGASGREPDREATEAAGAAYSSWFRGVLGEGWLEWVEVEPGIFRQASGAELDPRANAQARFIDRTLREAIEALTADITEAETDSRVDPVRSNSPPG